MSLDPIISIAVSLQARKGVYSVLLGSGVSRPSGIPTAWEVVVDLIHRIADLMGDERPADPAQWYREKFSGEPSYSHLLGELAKAPADRSHLLRSYFEPTDEEREEGLKVPTVAHRAIARLVAAGYVKVILTTNFDRLMEQALAEVGVSPNVVWSPASLEGMTPVQHSDCTVVKLHGDYLDLDTKNTLDELSEYTAEMNDLLDRLLSEYGLIVCGWSGDWDHALRDAIIRATHHRFSSYWLRRGGSSDRAKQVIDTRRAVEIEILSADAFFVDLEEKVRSIEESRASQPMSREIAIATTKRLLSEDRFRIRLEDLVNQEAERVVLAVSGEAFSIGAPKPDAASVVQRAERADAVAGTLCGMLAVGCYWGRTAHLPIWRRAMERVGSFAQEFGPIFDAWVKMKMLPAAFALYSAGIAALASENYETVAMLLTACRRRERDGQTPLIDGVSGRESVHHDVGSWLFPEMSGKPKTPGSDWLHHRLKPGLTSMVGGEERFTELFHRFEMLLSMAHYQLMEDGKIEESDGWMPDGRYIWHRSTPLYMPATFKQELREEGKSWPPLLAGMFDGEQEKAQKAIEAVEDTWKSQRF